MEDKFLYFFNLDEHPTTTVMQNRIPICSPNKKAKDCNKVTVTNGYGTLTYDKRRLGQRHKDVIDWVFSYHQKLVINGDGSVTYWFNPFSMLKDFGLLAPDIDELRGWLSDMLTAEIKVETPKFCIHTTPVTEYGYDKKNEEGCSHKYGNGDLFQITFSRRFMAFLELDLLLYYDKLLPYINKLEKPELRAIVKFCLTHTDICIGIDKLLTTLDIVRPEHSARYKRRIKSEIIEGITTKKITIKKNKKPDEIMENPIITLGISMDTFGNINYHQHGLVYFKNPEKPVDTKNATIESKNEKPL